MRNIFLRLFLSLRLHIILPRQRQMVALIHFYLIIPDSIAQLLKHGGIDFWIPFLITDQQMTACV